MSVTSAAIAEVKPQARSRVGNGSALLADVDGRSALFRRYRDIFSSIVAEAFGDDPTQAQLQLARRAASHAAWAEEQETRMVNGEEVDLALFNTNTNTLRRLLTDIGLARQARDITPDLHTYLASRAREAAAP